MVDPVRKQIRFGDGRFGARPGDDEKVVCIRYQVLQGLDALIAPGNLNLLTDIPDIPAADITVRNEVHAMGGTNIFPEQDRFKECLKQYRQRYRLITESDFEQALLQDFNDLQEAIDDPFRVLQAYAMPNQAPISSSDNDYVLQQRTGRVTLLAVPQNPPYKRDSLRTLLRPVDDGGADLSLKQQALSLDDASRERLLQFLDKRRLITTHIHVRHPQLVELQISMSVTVRKECNTQAMKDLLTERLYGFLDLFEGGFERRGWRPGEPVYCSHVYRLIAETEGVDYVKSLSLSPADADKNFVVEQHQLPVLSKKPSITVERAERS
jgi:hypothetical protein